MPPSVFTRAGSLKPCARCGAARQKGEATRRRKVGHRFVQFYSSLCAACYDADAARKEQRRYYSSGKHASAQARRRERENAKDHPYYPWLGVLSDQLRYYRALRERYWEFPSRIPYYDLVIKTLLSMRREYRELVLTPGARPTHDLAPDTRNVTWLFPEHTRQKLAVIARDAGMQRESERWSRPRPFDFQPIESDDTYSFTNNPPIEIHIEKDPTHEQPPAPEDPACKPILRTRALHDWLRNDSLDADPAAPALAKLRALLDALSDVSDENEPQERRNLPDES